MASYSFIDIAVLDEVRTRFAAGDAMAILSTGLDEILWANGSGASLFGYPGIETAIGSPPLIGPAASRQVRATAGFPAVGRDRPVTMRLAGGAVSRTVSFEASSLTMPDGQAALLFALPVTHFMPESRAEIAAHAIAGLSENGNVLALIDGAGAVLSATGHFETLGVAAETLDDLIATVAAPHGRLVKKRISSAKGLLPAGCARLTDDPAVYLLVAIDESAGMQNDVSPERAATADDDVSDAAISDDGELTAKPGEPAIPSDAAASLPPDGTAGLAEAVSTPGLEEHPDKDAEETDETEPSLGSPPRSPGQTEADAAGPLPVPDAGSDTPPGQHDRWYFADAEAAQAPDAPQQGGGGDRSGAPGSRAASTSPVKFVWRTAADGRFSAISDGFAKAVGEAAANVVGRSFHEVAATFGLDPDGDIEGLLERRDTWSGRCVMWPVAGTDLRIPVDLAALPVYGRDRTFSGFRGFGVARVADAVPAPGTAVLSLGEQEFPATPNQPNDAGGEDARTDDHADDPFRGEVPALTIVPKPERRAQDKIVHLAERRPAAEGGLSAGERTAFREIGDRLKKESGKQETSTAGGIDGDPDADSQAPGDIPAGPGGPDAGKTADTPGADVTAQTQPAVEIAESASPTVKAGAIAEEADNPPPPASPPPASLSGTQDGADAAGRPEERHGTADAGATPASIAAASNEVALPDAELPQAVPSAFAGVAPAGSSTILLSCLPLPILIHSQGLIRYANREFLRLTGHASLDEIEAAGGLEGLFAGAMEDDEDDDAPDRTMRLRTRDGDAVEVTAFLQSIPWDEGKALMLALRPVPAKQDEPEAFQLRLDELRAIIDTATDGVVLIASDGTIRSISRPAEALFGFDSADVAGKPFSSLFAIESQRAARDYLAGLSDNGVASVLNDGREVIGREAEGRFIPLFMTIGRLPDASGFCAVVRDITQWKRAEEDLTQARSQAERVSSQKTEFLARVSHEIRTPLNAIIGFSELMLDEKFGSIGNDRYRDYLRDINRSGNHVLDLVNDLLDISKIEAGEQELNYEAVSLNDTLAETVAMVQPQANRERVIIRSSFPSRLPEVVADLRSIRQIGLNLLSNAIRYTPAGGQVIVSTSYEPSGDVIMRVRDTGVGMSQAEVEQALKPFKQLNTFKRSRGDGTGLGLPLTKAMVEANRARFSIASTPGDGTLVEIVFPATRVLAD